MTGEVKINGLSELQKLLDTLPAKIEANVMRGALRVAAKVVKDEAAPHIWSGETGKTAESLKISTRIKDGVVKASLAAQGFEGYKAMWQEFGTKPHYLSVPDEDRRVNTSLSAKRGTLVKESLTTVNRRVREGFDIEGEGVWHPGVDPKPFLRPALDSQADAAVRAAGEYIKKRLATKHDLDTAHIMLDGDE